MALPPPPIQDLKGLPMSYQLWFNQIKQFVAGTGGTIAWSTVSKAGSNLNELTTRDHASLTALQGGSGGQYYHLTLAETGRLLDATQYTGLTGFIATLVNNASMFGLTSTSVDLTLNSTHGYVLVNSTAANRVITLPAATGKYRYQIKKTVAANLVTVTPNGADTIQGAATRVLTAQYESCTIYSDGSGVWYIEAFT